MENTQYLDCKIDVSDLKTWAIVRRLGVGRPPHSAAAAGLSR
jgi:hypothetical protein